MCDSTSQWTARLACSRLPTGQQEPFLGYKSVNPRSDTRYSLSRFQYHPRAPPSDGIVNGFGYIRYPFRARGLTYTCLGQSSINYMYINCQINMMLHAGLTYSIIVQSFSLIPLMVFELRLLKLNTTTTTTTRRRRRR